MAQRLAKKLGEFIHLQKKLILVIVILIFISGQQIEKNENNEAMTDDIEKQAEYVFQKINEILKESGATMDEVVKAQIFLTDIKDFKKVSAIRDKWFVNSKPVSTLLEVNAMTRTGAKIEIEVTAIVKK